MRQIRNTAVMEALSEDARAYGLKSLAPELDKEPSTLYAELNPYGDQSKGKMGFDDALETMRIIKSVRSLELAADVLGCMLLPLNAQPDGENLHDECAQAYEAVAEFLKAARGNGPAKNLVPLLNLAIKELCDVRKRIEDESTS